MIKLIACSGLLPNVPSDCMGDWAGEELDKIFVPCP